jgi:hypothetical protein
MDVSANSVRLGATKVAHDRVKSVFNQIVELVRACARYGASNT